VYFKEQNIRTADQEQKIIKEVNKLNSAIPYFPTRLDYLVELKNPNLDPEIEKLALNIISKKRKQLFPQTMDFYELASAYKALAILSIKQNETAKAKDYVKLAQFNIYKMKSIWLNEDLKIYRPILKITQRETDFGYVLPQWLLLLREEYDAYLLP
jgi:ribosomal protein L5